MEISVEWSSGVSHHRIFIPSISSWCWGQVSELVIAYSILVREISVGTFVDGSVRVLAARLAGFLVTGVPSKLYICRIPLRAPIVVGVASILGVLALHENICSLAGFSQDSSREKNYQYSRSPHLVVVEASVLEVKLLVINSELLPFIVGGVHCTSCSVNSRTFKQDSGRYYIL